MEYVSFWTMCYNREGELLLTMIGTNRSCQWPRDTGKKWWGWSLRTDALHSLRQ